MMRLACRARALGARRIIAFFARLMQEALERDGKYSTRLVYSYRQSILGIMKRPLGDTEFWILIAITEEPLHGYAMIERVAKLSQGEIALRTPTLYAALDRLEAAGDVELDRDEAVNGRLRRYFRISEVGRDRLAGEIERLERKAALAGRILAAIPGAPGTNTTKGEFA